GSLQPDDRGNKHPMMTTQHFNLIAVVDIARRRAVARLLTGLACAFSLIAVCLAQTPTPTRTPEPPKTLGIDQGTISLQTPDFDIKLLRSSQTISALMPHGANGFDFTPADWLE